MPYYRPRPRPSKHGERPPPPRGEDIGTWDWGCSCGATRHEDSITRDEWLLEAHKLALVHRRYADDGHDVTPNRFTPTHWEWKPGVYWRKPPSMEEGAGK